MVQHVVLEKKNNLLKNTKNINIFDNYNFIFGGGGALVVLFTRFFFWCKGRLLGVVDKIPLCNLTTRLI